ncbi:MAG: 1-acyl-sn-glycerol-3-phosphate acyltransferase [Lachnospiraceae bacterium]|nr:1-acyl-sn-glycerol-3-phosphate acyltransferase [Lachnospiraceae bacterium]
MVRLRLITTILTGLPYAAVTIPKADYMIAHKDRYDEVTRYTLVRQICRKTKHLSWTVTKAYGTENLPAAGGYIMYSNHQGKYDALGIINCHPKTMSVLWGYDSAKWIIAKQVAGLMDAKIIHVTEHREQIKILNELAREVANGKRYLIFPEGGYTKNRNNLQEFKSGCFMCSLKSKAPIVPVVIYDSWRSMDSNQAGIARTQVHFLPPIGYEEYQDLNKKELSDLVKNRIEAKLSQLRAEDPSYKG